MGVQTVGRFWVIGSANCELGVAGRELLPTSAGSAENIMFSEKYAPCRLSFHCFDPSSREMKPSAINSALARRTARNEMPQVSAIQLAFAVPFPEICPSREIDSPLTQYASIVLIVATRGQRAINLSTGRGNGIGRDRRPSASQVGDKHLPIRQCGRVNTIALSENRRSPARSSPRSSRRALSAEHPASRPSSPADIELRLAFESTCFGFGPLPRVPRPQLMRQNKSATL